MEEDERERQEGEDARDARRDIDEVMNDMNAYLASVVSSLPSISSIPPVYNIESEGRSHARFCYVSFLYCILRLITILEQGFAPFNSLYIGSYMTSNLLKGTVYVI